MSASRSRLVQELLEQNSAILHKMKDRSSSVHSYPEEEVQEAGTGGASEQAAAFRHPFPRHINKTPKDAVVKLGLYHSPQKYWRNNSNNNNNYNNNTRSCLLTNLK